MFETPAKESVVPEHKELYYASHSRRRGFSTAGVHPGMEIGHQTTSVPFSSYLNSSKVITGFLCL